MPLSAEDVTAIEQLVARHYYAYDERDPDAFADTFTDDGVLELGGRKHEGREALVRFVTGRRDRFPFQTVIDIFEFLAEDDLRCLVVRDPEALAKKIKEEPIAVLRWIVAKNR